jgi:hypothetical protein
MAKAYWVVCYLSVTEPNKHGKSRGVGAAGSFQAQGRGSRSIPFEPKQTAASPQCLYAFALLTMRGWMNEISERLEKAQSV